MPFKWPRPTFRFRALAIGPPKSGKSSLLVSCASHYVCESAALGVWKSTFIFILSLAKIADFIQSHPLICKAMLDLVLHAQSSRSRFFISKSG
jgi:hypothetical protein